METALPQRIDPGTIMQITFHVGCAHPTTLHYLLKWTMPVYADVNAGGVRHRRASSP